MPAVSGAPGPQRFEGLADVKPTTLRTLYFSEEVLDSRNPILWFNTEFFIRVVGATPQLFNPDNPPAITTTQGSVEDWTIENRTQEVYEFHIHQFNSCCSQSTEWRYRERNSNSMTRFKSLTGRAPVLIRA
jgi:hypothetical protein